MSLLDSNSPAQKTTVNLCDGVAFCRLIEPALAAAGYHCALGGGCLYKDGERKDIDVLIFPHGTRPLALADVEAVLKLIEPFGAKRMFDTPASAELEKVVEVCSYEGGRIDFFFFDARPRFTDVRQSIFLT